MPVKHCTWLLAAGGVAAVLLAASPAVADTSVSADLVFDISAHSASATVADPVHFTYPGAGFAGYPTAQFSILTGPAGNMVNYSQSVTETPSGPGDTTLHIVFHADALAKNGAGSSARLDFGADPLADLLLGNIDLPADATLTIGYTYSLGINSPRPVHSSMNGTTGSFLNLGYYGFGQNANWTGINNFYQATYAGTYYNNDMPVSGSGGITLPAFGEADNYNVWTGFSISLFALAAPEPASWGLMIAGFGAVGVALRRRGAAARPVILT